MSDVVNYSFWRAIIKRLSTRIAAAYAAPSILYVHRRRGTQLDDSAKIICGARRHPFTRAPVITVGHYDNAVLKNYRGARVPADVPDGRNYSIFHSGGVATKIIRCCREKLPRAENKQLRRTNCVRALAIARPCSRYRQFTI